jgi:transposase-like protein
MQEMDKKWHLKCDFCNSEKNDLAYAPFYDAWLCKKCQKDFPDKFIYDKVRLGTEETLNKFYKKSLNI